jgi:integrase/recombinase XerC
VVSAFRRYFRFRAACGDAVYALNGVLSSPANWQLASLPKALADEEIERLLQSLNTPGPTMRRGAAMVHCAVDLGLRSGGKTVFLVIAILCPMPLIVAATTMLVHLGLP